MNHYRERDDKKNGNYYNNSVYCYCVSYNNKRNDLVAYRKGLEYGKR